jgi:hypothetical protein
MNLGTGRSDLEDPPVDSIALTGPVTCGSAAVAEEPTRAPPPCGRRRWRRKPRAAPPPCGRRRWRRNSRRPRHLAVGGGGGGTHERQRIRCRAQVRRITRAPTVSVRSPRVVAGNGRRPGCRLAIPSPCARTPRSCLAVPVAIEVTIPPRRRPCRRSSASNRLGWWWAIGTAKIDTTTDPPVRADRVDPDTHGRCRPGYRQARAAQGLRESART